MRRLPPAPAHGAGGGAALKGANDHSAYSRAAATAQLPETHGVSGLRRNPRIRQLTERLWHLGPRPVGELLLEIALDHNLEHDTLDHPDAFAKLDSAIVARLDARDWPPLPIHEVAA